jgi:hypothetical protein
MVKENYFYNATIRKTVAVFGSLFNNIYTAKNIDGKLTDIARVPLAYGPRERFLARVKSTDIQRNAADIAIKLPRLSFEITSLSLDTTKIINRNNIRSFPVADNTDSRIKIQQGVPYILGMQLTAYADNQDNMLQIVEQILPSFRPEYTVSVKDMEGPGTRTDLPIILNGVTPTDDYEGDFESSRRIIMYTFDFSLKITFVGQVNNRQGIIKEITVNIMDGVPCGDAEEVDRIHHILGDPENDTPDNYTVITTFGFD